MEDDKNKISLTYHKKTYFCCIILIIEIKKKILKQKVTNIPANSINIYRSILRMTSAKDVIEIAQRFE